MGQIIEVIDIIKVKDGRVKFKNADKPEHLRNAIA